MALLVSTRFDEFEHALRGVDGRYLLKSRSTREWRLRMQEFGDATAMVARNGAAAVYQGALPGAHAMLIGLSRTDSCSVNGDRLCEEDVVWLPPGYEFHAPAEAGVRWMSVIVPHAEVRRWVDNDAIRLDPRFLDYCSGHADALAVRRVAGLVARGLRAADAQPEVPASHARHHALHGQLMDAVLTALQSMRPHAPARQGRPRMDSRIILAEAMHLIDQRLDQPIRIHDFCATVGVSATTLQKVFHERLGMSLHRYLMLRRLHAIHSALQHAGPTDTISSICSRFGVWDFGRFAAQYRSLFGVPPSSVLRRHA